MQEEASENRSGFKEFWFDIMDIAEAAILTVFLFLLIFAYLLRPVTVDGSSMNPTLYNEDQLLILTTLHKPQSGDIIVINDEHAGLFSDPEQQTVYQAHGLDIVIVKRLIARGGQQIDIDFETGTVSVDGKTLNEPYIAEQTTRNDGAFTYPMTVPEGYLFVMGDNRLGSTDSRNPAVALVPETQVIGTAFLRYGRDDKLCTSWTDRFAFLF